MQETPFYWEIFPRPMKRKVSLSLIISHMLAANYEGLVACNVSNPHNPTFLSSKYNMGYSYDVFINPNTPNLAYVCVDDEAF